jgi:hypothetical protein
LGLTPTYRHAYECGIECVEYVEALVESEALIVDLENLVNEVVYPKRHASSFKPTKTTKTVPLNLSSSVNKTLWINSELDPKYEAVLIDFLRVNAEIFAWSPLDIPGIPREVVEHSLDIQADSRPVKRGIIEEEVHKLLAARFIKEVFSSRVVS